MKRILHATPAARSALVAGLAGAYAGLPDDFPEVAHQPCTTAAGMLLLYCKSASALQTPHLQSHASAADDRVDPLEAKSEPVCCTSRSDNSDIASFKIAWLWCVAQVLWRVAGTLVDLMDEWRGLLLGEAASRAQSPEPAGRPDMDIARVEGFAISILCHPDVHVRLVSPHPACTWAPCHRTLSGHQYLQQCRIHKAHGVRSAVSTLRKEQVPSFLPLP